MRRIGSTGWTLGAELVLGALFALIVLFAPGSALALPSFARQTGLECTACHVGGFGPQYTDYGRTFKLRGYVDGDKGNALSRFSGMLFGGYQHTDRDFNQAVDGGASGPLTSFRDNDITAVDEASLFYGGRLLDHVGIFSQMTYNQPERSLSWDNIDLRYANDVSVRDDSLLLGVSINNNPTVQDVWQTTPAWSFPYVTSLLAPHPDDVTQPILANGTLSLRTIGGGIYGVWNDWLYAEITGYTGLSHAVQLNFGQTGADTADRLQSFNPYWRVAVYHNFGPHYVALGTFGMDAYRYPGNIRDFGSDHLTDVAVDGTYQLTLAGGKHIFTLYGSLIHEDLHLKGSNGANVATGSGADNLNDHLLSANLTASYYYDNTWGINLKRFDTWGNTDAGYFGTASGKPNSGGWVLQLDYTPFGGSSSPTWQNLRVFAQYTIYDRFNGGTNNYDGHGRSASDNNTLFTGLWFAF